MVRGRKRGPYGKGIERRQEIIDRALEVFVRRGYSKLSLRAIAEEIEVSHAAILHYFPSLEDLLLAVIEEQDAKAAGASRESRGLMDELVAAARYNVTVPGLIALYTTLLGASAEPNNEVARSFFSQRFASGRDMLARSIIEGRRAGSSPEGPDPRALASLVMAAFDGLQVQWLLDRSVDLPRVLSLLQPLIGEAPPLWAHAATQPAAAPDGSQA